MKVNVEKKVSRRVFLGNTGKLIGIGLLSHFAMVGKANELSTPIDNDITPEDICSKAHVCEDKQYACSSTSVHDCGKNQFSCGTGFDCNPVSKNVSNDKCVPVSSITE